MESHPIVKTHISLIKQKNDRRFGIPDDVVKEIIFWKHALNWSMKSLTSAYGVTSTKIYSIWAAFKKELQIVNYICKGVGMQTRLLIAVSIHIWLIYLWKRESQRDQL